MENQNKDITYLTASKKRKSKKGCLLGFLIAFIVIACLLLLSAGLVALYYYNTVPKLENLSPSIIAETSNVYAIDGSLLA